MEEIRRFHPKNSKSKSGQKFEKQKFYRTNRRIAFVLLTVVAFLIQPASSFASTVIPRVQPFQGSTTRHIGYES